MEPEDQDAEEPSEDETPDDDHPSDWSDFPWRRSVIAAPKDDLDSWPCPACKHPLAFHAVQAETSTNAFSKNHGVDYRFSCSAWLFAVDDVGSMAEDGEGRDYACSFHGIVGGAPWPAEYRPLYRYLDVCPETFNECEPEVEMTPSEWGPHEPPQRALDRWITLSA